MRFMSIVKATRESEAGARPDPALMAAIGKMGQEALRAGTIVDMGGLAPSAMGARVRASGGKLTVVDGPFAEIKELIAGYAILEVESKAQAIEEARKLLQVHLDILGPSYEGECEIRQLFCATDMA
jgi:hypothetical protein